MNVKEDMPSNEDEQEEENTPVPAWLTRLRDRRKRELKAKTADGVGKDPKKGCLVLKNRAEAVDKDGKSKGRGKSNQLSKKRDKKNDSKGTGKKKCKYN